MKERRASRRLTQAELAAAAGVTPNRIIDLEVGDIATPETIASIARALGVRTETLTGSAS